MLITVYFFRFVVNSWCILGFFRTMKLPAVDIRDYDNYDNYDDTVDQPIQTHFVIQLRLHLPKK